MIQHNVSISVPISTSLPSAQKILKVSHESQASRLWCWAAVLRMVLEKQPGQLSASGFPKKQISGLTQCAIVSVVRQKKCCDSKDPPCSDDLGTGEVTGAWTRFSVGEPEFLLGHLEFVDVTQQLRKLRPVQIGVGIGIEGEHVGHTVLVYGFHQGASPSDHRIYIHDPRATGGSVAIPYSDLVEGVITRPPWRWTWVNLPKVPEVNDDEI